MLVTQFTHILYIAHFRWSFLFLEKQSIFVLVPVLRNGHCTEVFHVPPFSFGHPYFATYHSNARIARHKKGKHALTHTKSWVSIYTHLFKKFTYKNLSILCWSLPGTFCHSGCGSVSSLSKVTIPHMLTLKTSMDHVTLCLGTTHTHKYILLLSIYF